MLSAFWHFFSQKLHSNSQIIFFRSTTIRSLTSRNLNKFLGQVLFVSFLLFARFSSSRRVVNRRKIIDRSTLVTVLLFRLFARFAAFFSFVHRVCLFNGSDERGRPCTGDGYQRCCELGYHNVAELALQKIQYALAALSKSQHTALGPWRIFSLPSQIKKKSK